MWDVCLNAVQLKPAWAIPRIQSNFSSIACLLAWKYFSGNLVFLIMRVFFLKSACNGHVKILTTQEANVG